MMYRVEVWGCLAREIVDSRTATDERIPHVYECEQVPS